MRTILLSMLIVAVAWTAEPKHPELPFKISELKLIDSVDLSKADPGYEFEQYPKNSVSYGEVLGRKALIQENKPGSGSKYVSVRIAKNKGLVAGKAYVITVDYPEDVARGFILRNHGAEITRGWHTGAALGDGLEIPYVYSHPESINYPLSGKWKQWVSVFHLHDKFSNIHTIRGKGQRPFAPKDGFHVVLAHFSHKDAPLSKGLALGKISIYEAPSHDEISLALTLPPKELPHRHLFYREEMADGVLGRRAGQEPGVIKHKDWFEYHARLMKYLGINTFSKDLLEFGANQGWDQSKYGGNKWVWGSDTPQLWGQIIDLAAQYDLNVLPYYEYCGSKGQHGHGNKKTCRTLYQRKKGPKGRDDYTHISWTEPHNADVTDPATYEDFRKMLDCTVTPFSNKANFAGVWIRTRNSQLPISFSDRCLDLYAVETGNDPVTRQQLIDNKESYQKYLDWWFGKRKEFLTKVRDFVQKDAGVENGVVLFTADASEGGTGVGKKGIVTDQPSIWKSATINYDDVLANKLALESQLAMRGTWGGWEWQHSVPPADPKRYTDTDDIIMTYGFNRLYTVSSTEQTDPFVAKDGLAMIRHYVLNEHAINKGGNSKDALLGYFVSDFDVAGPYHMLAEARALAYSDPKYLGYLASAVYSSGFTEYQRAFNQAFLSLPAVPSELLSNVSSQKEVMVREYKTKEHGTWYAVVNTDLNDAIDVKIKLPKAKQLVDAVTKAKVKAKAGTVTVSLYPGQVLTWHSDS